MFNKQNIARFIILVLGVALIAFVTPSRIQPKVSTSDSSSLWFTPKDLEVHGDGMGNSAIAHLKMNTNDTLEVLRLEEREGSSIYRAVNGGWSNAKSVTFRIYWFSEEDGVKFSPEIYSGYGSSGADLSSDYMTCVDACPITANIDSLGAKKLNVMEYTRQHADPFMPTESSLLNFSIYRNETGGGKVYILGISVTPNF